jgi:hypothetical protein
VRNLAVFEETGTWELFEVTVSSSIPVTQQSSANALCSEILLRVLPAFPASSATDLFHVILGLPLLEVTVSATCYLPRFKAPFRYGNFSDTGVLRAESGRREGVQTEPLSYPSGSRVKTARSSS